MLTGTTSLEAPNSTTWAHTSDTGYLFFILSIFFLASSRDSICAPLIPIVASAHFPLISQATCERQCTFSTILLLTVLEVSKRLALVLLVLSSIE